VKVVVIPAFRLELTTSLATVAASGRALNLVVARFATSITQPDATFFAFTAFATFSTHFFLLKAAAATKCLN